MIVKEIECKKKEIETLSNEYEKTFDEIVIEELGYIEEYCYYRNIPSTPKKMEFLRDIGVNYFNYKEDLLRKIQQIQKEIDELENKFHQLTCIEEDEDKDELIAIINCQITQKNIEINIKTGDYTPEQKWVYLNFFEVDIENPDEVNEFEKNGNLWG